VQLLQIGGLDQVGVEAGLEGAAVVVRQAVAGQGDEWQKRGRKGVRNPQRQNVFAGS
jgi:hypothetical protein